MKTRPPIPPSTTSRPKKTADSWARKVAEMPAATPATMSACTNTVGHPNRSATHDPRWPPIIADGVSAPTGMPMPSPTAAPATVTAALRWSRCPSCSATPSMMWPIAASFSGFRNRTIAGDEHARQRQDRHDRPGPERAECGHQHVADDRADGVDGLVEQPDPDGGDAAEDERRLPTAPGGVAGARLRWSARESTTRRSRGGRSQPYRPVGVLVQDALGGFGAGLGRLALQDVFEQDRDHRPERSGRRDRSSSW